MIYQMNKKSFMSGPRVNYPGTPTYKVGALTYVGSSTFNKGPKFLRWEYGPDTELICRGPALLCLGPYLLCLGPEIIM